jgi:signal transduction histidine kinase
VWTDIWAELEPLLSAVYRGESVLLENARFELESKGYREEGFFNFNYTPIRDGSGKVQGVLCTVFDATARIKAERSEKKAFVELAAEKIKLENAFMQVPSPMVILTGPQHYFTLANAPYERMVGRKVTGKTVLEVFTQEEVGSFVARLDHVYQTGVSYYGKEIPFDIPNEKGVIEKHFVNVGYHAFRGGDGSIQGIFAVHEDITDLVIARQMTEDAKETVEHERLNLRNLFRQTPEMLCMTRGPEHVFEFVNEAHIRVLGFDATGMSVRQAQPESKEVHGILDNVYRTGVTAELVEIPVTVSNRLRYFNLTYAAARDRRGVINGLMILGVEITDQIESRNRLTAALAARNEFVSIASHELKTPMTSLKLQTQLMKRNLELGRSEAFTMKKVGEFITNSEKQIGRLVRLVDDMLDFSMIDSGKLSMRKERTDLGALVLEVYERLKEQLESKGCETHLEILSDTWLEVDRFRIEQVITNLLTNASRYGEGKPITIQVASNAEFAWVSVADRGRGIAEGDLERIFNRFERAVSPNEVAGLGLGLYISRQIVEAHRGKIRVESKLGVGSKFKVELPLTRT